MAPPKDNYEFENASAIPSPFDTTIPAFFRAWDNPHSRDDDYLPFFAPDCSVVFVGVKSTGHEAIRSLRANFIDPVKGPVVQLQHTLQTCWMLTGGSNRRTQDIIVRGSIWYVLRNGRRVETDCISYMKMMDKGDGSWQAVEYEVYLCSGEIMDAVKELAVEGQ
jgi:hypothetical protein